MAGYASIAMFGNTQQPIDVMLQTGHLFAPMPDVIRDDMAFIDRLHFYLPGWEVPKMHNEHFTDHYGFVVDYLAEALRDLRKRNYTEIIDHHFAMGAHLNARDRKAVRRTVSGLVKILHPHGQVSRDDMEELLQLALEGRRRVKEQLKKMGSFEYYQTSFSYQISETGEEKFVGVPEQGGKNLISPDPLAPGTIYSASVSGDGTVGMYRIEISISSGAGKLKPAGGISGALKESINRAFSYLLANKNAFGVGRDVDASDFHVEVIDLLGNKVEAELGVAFFVAAYSILRKAPPQPGLLVLGDMSVQGNVKPIRSLVEPLHRHGQRCQASPHPHREQASVPRGQPGRPRTRGPHLLRRPAPGGRHGQRCQASPHPHREQASVPRGQPGRPRTRDPIFYGDLRQAAFKALGLN